MKIICNPDIIVNNIKILTTADETCKKLIQMLADFHAIGNNNHKTKAPVISSKEI